MNLALLATVRDEAPYLIDWIAHHRAIGFNRFVIYQNDSVDGTDTLLQSLHDAGEITYFDNTNPNDAPFKFRTFPPQRRAYARALRASEIQTADYIFVIDADEYLELPVDHDVPTLLERLQNPDVICFPWRMMGSSNQVGFSPEPVTSRFTTAAAPEETSKFRAFHQVKSLYPPKITRLYNLHKPRVFREDAIWLSPDGTPIRTKMFKTNRLGGFDCQTANLRHYHVKSYPEFCVKIVRGFPCTPIAERSQLGAKMFAALDTDTVFLPLSAALAAKSAEIAAQIRANQQVAHIETACIARFETLKQLCQHAVDNHDTLPTFASRYRMSEDLQPYFEATVWSKMRA
jgi:hypothetical protein